MVHAGPRRTTTIFQLLQLKSAIGLELKGLKHSRGSAIAFTRKLFGVDKVKPRVQPEDLIEQCKALIDSARAAGAELLTPFQINIEGMTYDNPRRNPFFGRGSKADYIAEMRTRTIYKPGDIVDLIRLIEDKEPALHNAKEHFWAIGLNTRNNVSYVDLVSMGTLNYNLVHPRESFRRAIHEGVASVIFVHNHPSDTAAFSDEDLTLMKRLQQAGKLVGIEMLDFCVYAGGTLLSAKKEHQLI